MYMSLRFQARLGGRQMSRHVVDILVRGGEKNVTTSTVRDRANMTGEFGDRPQEKRFRGAMCAPRGDFTV